MQQIIEKRKEHNFLLFRDNETACDNVNRDKMWGMVGNEFPNYLLNTVKYIYRNTMVGIKFNDAASEPIHTNKGVRQGRGLSPVLFNTYINKIMWEIKRVMKKSLQQNNRKSVNTVPYAGGHIVR